MPYQGPPQMIASVLKKLGIDPDQRIGMFDQDPEYTACEAEEIPLYFSLYGSEGLEIGERMVLCCFMLEGLNERIQAGDPHPLQEQIFKALFDASEIHADELAYWMDNSQSENEDDWWPITRPILEYQARRTGS
jgi:hypothetical protein